MNPCVSILGVRIDAVTLQEARNRILELSRHGQHHVMTPNPEMLVAADRDPAFKALLNSSALNIPDGAGLLWAARCQKKFLPERVTGVDVLSALCAAPECPTVFLLGAGESVAEKAADALRKKNPSLTIAGTYSGSPHLEDESEILMRINASGAQILFVAYGAPAQDFWIEKNLKRMPSVRVAMGVGGAFDFLAGVRSRAPLFMQSLGIEWLWRLIQEPRRIKRIFTAVVVFPFLVLTRPQVRSA